MDCGNYVTLCADPDRGAIKPSLSTECASRGCCIEWKKSSVFRELLLESVTSVSDQGVLDNTII